MSFFKKLFGKNSDQEKESNEESLPWIEPADNPWNVRLLDLRPISHTMLSSSNDPRMAENAISYSGEDGTTFWNQKPENNRSIVANLTYPIEGSLAPGVLFTPNTMEHKWAIYFDGEYVIFIRSWLRQVVVVAKTYQRDNQLFVEQITGEFSQGDSEAFTISYLNFLLISHAVGEIVPAPLPLEHINNSKNAGYWAFSSYGNMAHIGVFDEHFISNAKGTLRTHSLLHIAVAKSNVTEIERHINNGMGINALAGDGLAPLHWSIAVDKTDSMEKLLQLGADPNARTNQGATPMMNAVQSNKMDHLIVLIKNGASVNAIDDRGFTALHRAAEMGHFDMVRVLLENGADKFVAAEGHTALSLATGMNHKGIIEILA